LATVFLTQIEFVAFHFLNNHGHFPARITMSRFIRLKLWKNSWEEHEESFLHMNRHLKFIESLWDVLEETLLDSYFC